MINHFTQRIARAKAELIALAILAPLAIVLGTLLLRWPDSRGTLAPPLPASSPAHSLLSPATQPPATQPPAATVSLVIESPGGTRQIPAPVAAGATAADVLRAVQATGQLTADVKDFGGELGIFVEALNGLANDPSSNQYWFLYTNGAKSAVGASSAPVHAGDTVTWKYEPADDTE